MNGAGAAVDHEGKTTHSRSIPHDPLLINKRADIGMTFRFTPAGNWDATDEVIPSSTLIKPLWRWVELVAPIASRLNLVPQSYVTHGGAAAGQLHLFQKRVLSYRVTLATKWRLPPRIQTSAQRAPRRPKSVKGPGGRSTRPDNTRPAGQAFLTEMSQSCRGVRIRLDFCRKGRIAMCVGRWIWLPGETLRARPAMCGALGRASVNSDAANQRSPNDVDPFHKIPEHEERRT